MGHIPGSDGPVVAWNIERQRRVASSKCVGKIGLVQAAAAVSQAYISSGSYVVSEVRECQEIKW